jgi:alkyl hydroperoxide reductase subunit AhpC
VDYPTSARWTEEEVAVAKPPVLVGTRAPVFALSCTRGSAQQRQDVTQDDFLNRWLILLFYPRDFSLVCPTELTDVSNRIAEFQKRDCDVLGISTDSLETHERWLTTPSGRGGLGRLHFPLASDESGAVCAAYGVLLPRTHVALRGLFIIDPNGVLQYQAVHNLSVGRSTDEVLRVLDALTTGGYCPAGWTPGAPTIDPGSTLGPESMMGPYRIEAVVGSGSFGTVFRAWDTLLERRVALKVLSPGKTATTDGLLAEARAAAGLNHPNICIVHAIDTAEAAPTIVMEYLDGRPLSSLLEAGPLPRAQAAALGRQVASGMAAAHAHGVVHGDLKPGNIMVTGAETAKIMDFGLARRYAAPHAEEAARPRGISGTPAYMSPEQVRGELPSPASDVFALGLILYEMLTGMKAVATSNVLEALHLIERLDPAVLARQTAAPFADILLEALVRDAARRTIRMEQIAQALA